MITFCVGKLLHFALIILLHFALVLLHFAGIVITFCVSITFCGDYYILTTVFTVKFNPQTKPLTQRIQIAKERHNKSKGSMSQLIHSLGMKLRESVSCKVVYKVILVLIFTVNRLS